MLVVGRRLADTVGVVGLGRAGLSHCGPRLESDDPIGAPADLVLNLQDRSLCPLAKVAVGGATWSGEAFARIEEIRDNTTAIIGLAAERGVTPREAAEDVALERVRSAMALRRAF